MRYIITLYTNIGIPNYFIRVEEISHKDTWPMVKEIYTKYPSYAPSIRFHTSRRFRFDINYFSLKIMKDKRG